MSSNIQVPSNDLLELIEASLNANYTEVRKVSNRIAALALVETPDVSKKIKLAVRRNGVPLRTSGYSETLPTDPKSRFPLVEEHSWPVNPIFLEEDLKNTFDAFIADVSNYEKLLVHGLTGKTNLLMSGPPGTGKTLVAGHIAAKLGRPMYVVRLDSLVSSLLGDTAKNIRSVFDFVPAKNGILFLDEFDAIAKLRDDKHELGELKRVVNTLIQAIDSLDDKAIVIAATNHSGLLDPAIFRRFPYKMSFCSPEEDLRKHLWSHFLYRDNGDDLIVAALAKISFSLSGADIESISISARRASLLADKDLDILNIVKQIALTKSALNTNDFEIQPKHENKKDFCRMLSKKYNLNQAEILKIVKISRQTLSNYLKE